MDRTLLIILLSYTLLVGGTALGQTPAKEELNPTVDRRPAQVLFEETDSYVAKKYAEFNKQKLPYDPKLEQKTKEAQRELAATNAANLRARRSLSGDDVYYLGMLEHLSGNAEAALEAMRLFLKDDPDGQKSQTARNVVVLYTVKLDLIPEAETAIVAYTRHQPQNTEDRYRMELVITDALSRARDYERMLGHAKRTFEAARSFSVDHKSDVFKRDEMLFKSAALVSDAYDRANQKAAAITALEDVRRIALSLPSGNLYKMATVRLASLD